MKINQLKMIIREVVREELKIGLKEVLGDIKEPIQSKPTRAIEEKKHYSKNSVLNDVLNETAQDSDWKTMGGSEFTSDRMNELVGGQYGDMMNGTQQVPSSDPMSQFLNKDYSEVLEKSMEKSNRKHGR